MSGGCCMPCRTWYVVWHVPQSAQAWIDSPAAEPQPPCGSLRAYNERPLPAPVVAVGARLTPKRASWASVRAYRRTLRAAPSAAAAPTTGRSRRRRSPAGRCARAAPASMRSAIVAAAVRHAGGRSADQTCSFERLRSFLSFSFSAKSITVSYLIDAELAATPPCHSAAARAGSAREHCFAVQYPAVQPVQCTFSCTAAADRPAGLAAHRPPGAHTEKRGHERNAFVRSGRQARMRKRRRADGSGSRTATSARAAA